jgi:hypothetical protein
MQEADALQYGGQGHVHDVAWEPGSGRCLAVAHQHGVVVWRKAIAQESPALHSQLSSSGIGNDWLPAALPWHCAAPASRVAWHPEGLLLAACSLHHNAIFVWDPLRRTTGPQRCWLGRNTGAHLLRWSPCGCYLLVGMSSSVLPSVS